MPRAADKLAEAEFFLRAMEETRGEQPAFRYYASATITAARSIGLVLQADLRSAYGSSFDEWWERTKEKVPTSPMGFTFIRSARNIILKEGNRILRPVLRAEYVEGPVSAMEVTLDPGSDSKVSAIRVALRPDTEFSNLSPPAEGAESADLTDDEINEFVAPRVESLLNLLTKRLHDGEGKLEPQGFEVEVGGPPLSFPEVLEGLRTHLAAMRNLLAEAALKFPLPHRKT